jgi:LuxR family maltose regulon positive regulatory protein
LQRKLTLISAPAGSGKTTLVSEWVAGCDLPVAWLSLDANDNDLTRFLAYLVASLQTIAPDIGRGMLVELKTPLPPPDEAILTNLLNEISARPGNFVFVLDDYHVIDARPVDDAVVFLLEHLPPQMHLVIATREDPQLPLSRLRARGQMTELRAADLRFTPAEAAEFLTQVMGLNLSASDVAALEERNEGWMAGLQLAAISMQKLEDVTGFIESFTGTHHFVLDYLLEEVLHQQSASVQRFLLRTSILDLLSGPLCDAVLLDPAAPGQATLEYLERANLFIVPLDNERRWFRYHHLFADLLRQRLLQVTASSSEDAEETTELHRRASRWYEANHLELRAFQHAAAANDVEHAERLIGGKGIARHSHGVVTAIVNWLESLPASVLNARPSLWWRYGSLLLVIGQTTGVEEKLQAAEDAMDAQAENDRSRNLVGQIAGARAVLALTRYEPTTMLAQARRALEYLDADNLSSRASANWPLGFGHFFQGDLAAAKDAFTEGILLSEAAGDTFTTILTTGGLGQVQEAESQLHQAAETYQRVLQLAGDQPLQIISGAHLGLARILYEWNDLDAAEQHAQLSLQLARQYDRVIDRFIFSELMLARLKLARGDVDGAAALLEQTNQSAHQPRFVHRISDVAEVQVSTLLHQGDLAAAAQLAQAHSLPFGQARVALRQGETSAALTVLEKLRQQAAAKGWSDERLKVMVLQAVALQAHGDTDEAVLLLGDALALAQPGGYIRLFVDEGAAMAQLLSEALARGIQPEYCRTLLAAFDIEARSHAVDARPDQSLIEPLSQRELEVLRLIAQGLSNREISDRLYVALDTVKGHNRKIFGKLDVQRRTEAIARARELGLL